MKKKCSSTAISISNPIVSCPTVVPVTPKGCVDPLTYLFNLAFSDALATNKDLDDAVSDILMSGLVIPTSNQICCPECEAAPFYALTNTLTFDRLGSKLKWWQVGPNVIDYCCINYIAPSGQHSDLQTNFRAGQKFPDCCDNNFTECANLFNNDPFRYMTIVDDGLVEVNSLKGQSGLCNLYNILSNLPKGVRFKTTATTFVLDFLAAGFVTHCCGCFITLRNIQAFENYIDDNDCPDLNP